MLLGHAQLCTGSNIVIFKFYNSLCVFQFLSLCIYTLQSKYIIINQRHLITCSQLTVYNVTQHVRSYMLIDDIIILKL